MKRGFFILAGGFLTLMLVLGGCTSTLSSPERHAKHFVYASNSDSDPNFRTRMQESVRTSVPFFEQIYQLGQKDNAAGINHDQAKKRAEYFYGDDFLDGIQRKEDFAGKSYSQLQTQKWRMLMSQEAAGAYMDGYNGVK